MCRQGQYGPRLALGQESAVFGAENNNLILFSFFLSPITCMSPLNECSAVSSTGRIDSLMVTWYTDFLGFTAWSELDILKGWLSVTLSEVFAFVSLAVLQCGQKAGTGLSIHSESLSPTQRKLYLDLILKFSNLTNQHFQIKEKKIVYQKHLGQKSGYQVTWEGTYFSGAVKTWHKVFHLNLFSVSVNLVALK